MKDIVIANNCEYCGKQFYSKRQGAMFCCPSHQARFSEVRRGWVALNHQLVNKFGKVCMECGNEQSPRYFTWTQKDQSPTIDNSYLVCGLHHSELSSTEKSYARRDAIRTKREQRRKKVSQSFEIYNK